MTTLEREELALHARPRSMTALHDWLLDEPVPEGRLRIVVCAPELVTMWRDIIDHRAGDHADRWVILEGNMRQRVVTWLALKPGVPGPPRDRTGEGPPATRAVWDQPRR
jgi:hypothetical protein